MSKTSMNAILVLVYVLTFVHHAGAQMRGPVLPLLAVALGATPTGVGLILGAHTLVAAIASIPLGRASDLWGRRAFLQAGMGVGVLTSLLLAVADDVLALAVLSGLAGLGIAAFSPSALSLVADTAKPSTVGRAYAWYSTAHYGAIAVGPFLGGLAAERWGYRGAFVASAALVGVALAIGLVMPARPAAAGPRPGGAFARVRSDSRVWAGWIAAVSGLLVQGVIFTFFPLVALERGFSPAAIGTVFLVLGSANTLARVPAGWLVDRTGRCPAYAVGGLLVASMVAALLPHAGGRTLLLALVAGFGAASGFAFVAVSVALAACTTPATRGVVMGGYSAALYLGLAVGSFAFGPVVTHHGHAVSFAAGAAVGALGTVAASVLWARSRNGRRPADRAHPRAGPAGSCDTHGLDSGPWSRVQDCERT